jgi:hypothetical protein
MIGLRLTVELVFFTVVGVASFLYILHSLRKLRGHEWDNFHSDDQGDPKKVGQDEMFYKSYYWRAIVVSTIFIAMCLVLAVLRIVHSIQQ